MPAIIGDPRVTEKFQDPEYLTSIEHMFREKFIENLDVSQIKLFLYLKDNVMKGK